MRKLIQLTKRNVSIRKDIVISTHHFERFTSKFLYCQDMTDSEGDGAGSGRICAIALCYHIWGLIDGSPLKAYYTMWHHYVISNKQEILLFLFVSFILINICY